MPAVPLLDGLERWLAAVLSDAAGDEVEQKETPAPTDLAAGGTGAGQRVSDHESE